MTEPPCQHTHAALRLPTPWQDAQLARSRALASHRASAGRPSLWSRRSGGAASRRRPLAVRACPRTSQPIGRSGVRWALERLGSAIARSLWGRHAGGTNFRPDLHLEASFRNNSCAQCPRSCKCLRSGKHGRGRPNLACSRRHSANWEHRLLGGACGQGGLSDVVSDNRLQSCAFVGRGWWHAYPSLALLSPLARLSKRAARCERRAAGPRYPPPARDRTHHRRQPGARLSRGGRGTQAGPTTPPARASRRLRTGSAPA